MLSACTDLHLAFAVLCSLHGASEVSVGCFCCIVWSSHFAVLLNVRYSSARLEFPDWEHATFDGQFNERRCDGYSSVLPTWDHRLGFRNGNAED